MIGERLGPYRIESELGAGGMGTVYRAVVEGRAPGLAVGATVALKLVHPRLLETAGFFQRFLREAEVGRAVRSPNVVRTLDADARTVAGVQHHYLVMEFVRGQTLRALRDELGRVPEDLCRHIAAEIARGLVAIHAAGVVHRDLKPENVLITPEHDVKIMDLGVARLMDEAVRLSRTGVFVGSLLYAAPEQFGRSSRDLDGRVDLFALGVLLHELAAGVHPFRHSGDDVPTVLRRIRKSEPRGLAAVAADVSPFFVELVLRLLSKDRGARFDSAEELVRVLADGQRSAWWCARERDLRDSAELPLPQLSVGRETSLHGRAAELGLLDDAFESARSGAGRVILLEGEAGVGKTRLVDAFVERGRAARTEFHFLFGAYPPGGAATPGAALQVAVREHFGVAGLDDQLAARLKTTPALAAPFAAYLRGDAVPTGSAAVLREALQALFVGTLVSLAAERPVVVFADDLHQAPDEGLGLVAALASSVRDHRVLLVVATRPRIDASWVGELLRLGHAQALRLGRLGPKDLFDLLAEALRSQRLVDRLGPEIARKADGNPFFVFEILRGLRDGCQITRSEDGSWDTTAEITEIRMPSSVRELIAARVAQLTEEERDLLDVAACCGYEFDPLVVGAVTGLRRISVLKRLAHIERRLRIVRSAGLRHVFDHYQVREYLYEEQPELLRREYHGAIADALTAQTPDPTDDAACGLRAVERSRHLFAAQRGGETSEELRAALTFLDQRHRVPESVRLAELALGEPGLLAEQTRVEALLAQAERLDILARRPAERAALDEARRAAYALDDAGLRARVLTGLGRHLCLVAEYAAGSDALTEALALAERSGDGGLVMRAAGALGAVRYSTGDAAGAKELHERHLTLALGRGDRAGEATARGNLGLALAALGRRDDAGASFRQAAEAWEELAEPRGRAIALGNLGLILAAGGDLSAAAEAHETSLELARSVGDRAAEARATGNLGNVLSAQGRNAAALERLTRQVELTRDIADLRGEARATGNLGTVLQALGRPGAAAEHFHRYLALAGAIGDRPAEAIALVNLASVCVAVGDFEQALTHAEAARSICSDVGLTYVEPYVDLWAGNALLHSGDTERARELLSRSAAAQTSSGNRAGEAESRLALATCLGAIKCEPEACAAELDAVDCIAADVGLPGLALVAAAERAALPGGSAVRATVLMDTHAEGAHALQLVRVRLRLWEATRDREHLAAAQASAAAIRAEVPPEWRARLDAAAPWISDVARVTATHADPDAETRLDAAWESKARDSGSASEPSAQ